MISAFSAKEEGTIRKRLVPVLFASVCIGLLAGCARGDAPAQGDTGGVPSNAEITLARSVLSPDQGTGQEEREKREPVTITFYHSETGMRKRALTALTESFHLSNNGAITVELRTDADSGETDEAEPELDTRELTVEDGASEAVSCDLALLDAASFAAHADDAAELDSFVEAGFDNYDDVFVPLREQAASSGKTAGIPFDATGSVFYYNRELFDEYGLTPPKNWTELKQCAETLMEERQMPLLCTDDACALLEILLNQNETGFLSGNRVLFNNPGGRETMELLLTMIAAEHIVFCRDGRTGTEAFSEGRAASYIGDSTDMAVLMDLPFEAGAAALFGNKTGAAPVRARMLAVFTEDAGKQEACRTFIRYMTATDVNAKWAAAAGLLPVRHSAFTAQVFYGYMDYDDAARASFGESQSFFLAAECPNRVRDMVRLLLEDYAFRGVDAAEACRALEEEITAVLAAE